MGNDKWQSDIILIMLLFLSVLDYKSFVWKEYLLENHLPFYKLLLFLLGIFTKESIDFRHTDFYVFFVCLNIDISFRKPNDYYLEICFGSIDF